MRCACMILSLRTGARKTRLVRAARAREEGDTHRLGVAHPESAVPQGAPPATLCVCVCVCVCVVCVCVCLCVYLCLCKCAPVQHLTLGPGCVCPGRRRRETASCAAHDEQEVRRALASAIEGCVYVCVCVCQVCWNVHTCMRLEISLRTYSLMSVVYTATCRRLRGDSTALAAVAARCVFPLDGWFLGTSSASMCRQ